MFDSDIFRSTEEAGPSKSSNTMASADPQKTTRENNPGPGRRLLPRKSNHHQKPQAARMSEIFEIACVLHLDNSCEFAKA